MQNCRNQPSIQNYRPAETRKLNQNYIWDNLEIDWKEVSMTFNENKVDLPRIVTIKLREKIKIRCMMKKEILLFHVMLKQGITWFTLTSGAQETV